MLTSGEQVMEAVCVMYTNSVNMELGPGHGAATAFYPVFAHMNHDCGCNTQTVKLPRCGPSPRNPHNDVKGLV